MRDSSTALEKHSCGGDFELVSEPGTFLIYGTEIPVDHLFYRCASCGEEQVTEDLAGRVQAEAARIYRERFNFLTGAGIRAVRERLGLTQEQLESALGIGAKSLARWENERVLQNRSVDDLLRLIDRDPSALRFLAQVHGTAVPVAGSLESTSAVDGTKWPRVLVAQLAAAAQREKVDLNSYLIMVLTQHVTERNAVFSTKHLDATVRALQQKISSAYERPMYDEPWQARHEEVMREAETGSPHAA